MRYILFFLSFALTFSIQAQSGSLKGKVTDQYGNALPNVNIRLSNTSLGGTTDNQGNYLIIDLAPESYVLTFSMIGYQTENISIVIEPSQTVTVPQVILLEKQERLNEVVVEGHHDKYIAREPSKSLRLTTEVAKLPQNIQIVNGELLQDQLVTNIMEGAIRNVSGVTMLEHWGNFARVNMRGFRIPEFRNGFNFSDTWGPLAMDMNNVERIEFVKGPSGFTNAAGEPGGFYNVVTKKPTENFIAQASLVVGSFDFYRGTVDVGGDLSENGKLLGRINGFYRTSDTHRGGEPAESYGFAPALTYNFSESTSFTAEMNLQQAESYLGSAYVFAPVEDGFGSLDRDFKFTDNNYPATDIQEVSFFGDFVHAFSSTWSMTAKAGYLRYDQVGNSTWLWSFDPDSGDAVRYASVWDALSEGKFAQIYLNGEFNTFGIKHKVLAAFDFTQKEYWADFGQFGLIDTTVPFNIYNPVYGNTTFPEFDRSVDVKNRAGVYTYGFINRSYYAQDEIGLFDEKVRLTLAGRYTDLSTVGKVENDNKFTPRIGLSVDVLPTLAVYGLYDQSFLAQAGIDKDGNFFEPKEANDIEGGIKKSFFDGRLRASLGAYIITKTNELTADPENPNFSIQLGEIQSKGIEFDLQGQVTPELNVVLNYANTNVEITEDSDETIVGSRVAGHAKHMTNGWLNYNFSNSSSLKGFGASLGYQYQIDRSTWSWGAENQSLLPDYFRMDGALSWKNEHLQIQLNVNNLLNEYLYSGADFANYLYWQSEPGINGRLGIIYTF